MYAYLGARTWSKMCQTIYDNFTSIESPHAIMPGTRGPVPVPLQTETRDLTLDILATLQDQEPFKSQDVFPDTPQAEIKAALDRLASRSMVTYETNDREAVILTAEGQQIANEGSHEYKVWKAVQENGKLSLKELPVCIPVGECARDWLT